MINRRGTFWILIAKDKLSLAIGIALVCSAFTLGAAGAVGQPDSTTVTLTLSLDTILRYVVQPLILLLLAVLGWFIKSAYGSIQDSQRKTHERIDGLVSRVSYIEGLLSTNSKES